MKKKILTVCIGGVVRSVGLKDVLNNHYGCDAINVGALQNTADTIRMLCRWADVIVPVEPRELAQGPNDIRPQWQACPVWEEEFSAKLKVVDLGPDIWGAPRNEDLKQKCLKKAKEILNTGGSFPGEM